MIVAAMMVCLGHGANDVSNSISPLVVAAQANGDDGTDDNARYPYYVGSTGIALGLLCLGSKVMETVGKKIVEFDFAKGYCAQFASAITVIIGTIFGLPLSTTHCMVGAIFGIALALDHLKLAKEAYPTEPKDQKE